MPTMAVAPGRSLCEALGITEIGLGYDDGTKFGDLVNDVTVNGSTLLGSTYMIRNGVKQESAVGDVSLAYNAEGWRQVDIVENGVVVGYAIEFETGEELRYGVVKEGVGSANINLDTLVLDGATGDSRANILIATGHSRSVQISGGDGNDVLRRRRGMIPGWPGHPRAGGKRHVQCGSGRPLPVAAIR